MKLELHILQNFAPSNLNRDDTGAPKDCELGGYRRARISSQCWKRAIREAFKAHELFGDQELAVRTKRLVEQVANAMKEKHGRQMDSAAGVVRALLQGIGLGVKDEQKTEYLLFLPHSRIEALAALANGHWDTLAPIAAAASEKNALPADAAKEGDGKKSKSPSSKDRKKAAKETVPSELSKQVGAILADGTKAPDLALFGRMIADKPEWNVEAASQVAHALSTNRVSMEFDFYTAVDDFRSRDTTGSDMMGTIQFNSSCFYRYLVLDGQQLASNLGEAAVGDPLTRRTIEAFVRAAIHAMPTGKQNSMAAQNLPSYVLAVVRRNAPSVSLANAFLSPVRPKQDADLVDGSIDALERYFENVGRMYGWEGLAISAADHDLAARQPISRSGNLEDLVKQAVTAMCESR